MRAVFGEPERWWSAAELAGRAGVQPNAMLQLLRRLRDGGIVRERHDAGRPSFQANAYCPVYEELQRIATKLAPISDRAQTILVVEDQAATARITRILLESWGYRVLEAQGGCEAIRIFEQHRGRIDLLLTDLVMPGISGTQLAEELMRRQPELRVVCMSGYAHENPANGIWSFLQKPFNPAGLSKAVSRELNRSPAGGRKY